jgi:hypothetical protein
MSVNSTLVKDSSGNGFNLRTQDVSSAQDGSLRRSLVFATPYPVDYAGGGCYQCSIQSNTVGAGLNAGAPIYSFRFVSGSMVALLRTLCLSAWSMDTGFAYGQAMFEVFVARSYTVGDTGGLAAGLSRIFAVAPRAPAAVSVATKRNIRERGCGRHEFGMTD